MAKRQLPSPEVLRQLLRYEPETGKLFWKERRLDSFASKSRGKAWNAKYAGREALAHVGSRGYPVGTLNNFHLCAHRVALALHFGAWPEHGVDHLNGDKLDNRLLNLRIVPQAENNKNKRRLSNNTSGVTGVTFCPSRGKWEAYIKLGGKKQRLGYFASIDMARAARQAAASELGFSARHGGLT